MENTQQKLDRIAKLGNQLTQWEQGFSESVLDQYKRRGSLSGGQITVVDKILAKHNPEARKAREDWSASYDDAKRDLARKMAQYYIDNPPYYGDVAHKILNDSEYIPSKKCFEKMTGNKYAVRYLERLEIAPTFEVGQLVRFRRNGEVRGHHRHRLIGRLAVVLSCAARPGAAKGSRAYKVLPTGEATPIDTIERRLMRCKCL